MSEHAEPDGAKPADEPARSLMRCIECDIVSRDIKEMVEHYRDTRGLWNALYSRYFAVKTREFAIVSQAAMSLTSV